MADIIVGTLLAGTWIALAATVALAARADLRAWSQDYDIRKAADSHGLAAATSKARRSKFRYAKGSWF
jgi:hypothetical protein